MLSLLKKQDRLQYEFLPSVLEISETPASPAGRATIWIIFGIFIFAIAWACIGEIDEVAVAKGKVIPAGKLKVVQPLEEGIITAIHVSEGQQVAKGELLIELDSTMEKVDADSLANAIEAAKLERDLLKKAIYGEKIEDAVLKGDLPEEFRDNLLQLTRLKASEYKVKQQIFELMIEQSRAQLDIAHSDLQKLTDSIVVLKQKEQKLKGLLEIGGAEKAVLSQVQKSIEILEADEDKYKSLYQSGAISRKEWEDKSNELILAKKEYTSQKVRSSQEEASLELNWENAAHELELAEKELEAQQYRVEQAKSSLEEAKANLENLEKERDTSTLDMVVEKDKQIAELEAQLAKARKSVQIQSLVAPVAGTVHGLASNTVGGVVTPAQPVMTIVPDGTELVVEASLLNKDVGFVSMGQEASLKFDTFPFQKYGTIKGRVESISADAFDDEKLGAVYKMKGSMEENTITVNGQGVRISPGMSVTVEIKTGKRRVIEFFLEPIIKYAEESLKLR